MPPVYWPLCCLFPHWELKSVSSKVGWCQIQICIYPVVLNIAQTSRCWPLLRLLDLHNPRNLTSHLPAIDELEPCGYEAPGGYSSLRSLTQRLLATFWETSHRYCKPCFHPLSLENSLIILHFWVAIPLCHRLWTNSLWKGHSSYKFVSRLSKLVWPWVISFPLISPQIPQTPASSFPANTNSRRTFKHIFASASFKNPRRTNGQRHTCFTCLELPPFWIWSVGYVKIVRHAQWLKWFYSFCPTFKKIVHYDRRCICWYFPK